MSERFRVEIAPTQSVAALAYSAANDRAGVTLILAHGAGGGQSSAFIVAFATALAERGIDVITSDFPYIELGRRVPDPNARLEGCYRAVIDTVRERGLCAPVRLAIGGKSMGGRIASQVAAGNVGEFAGLVFLGYPLHPPGRTDRLRAAHLPDVKAPMLFVQGSRDAFGTPEELRPIIEQIGPRADLFVVEGAITRSKYRRAPGGGTRTSTAPFRIGSQRGCATYRPPRNYVSFFFAVASAEAAAVATSRG
jgi:predicted alpha/beta-hydrolase family hydrolase